MAPTRIKKNFRLARNNVIQNYTDAEASHQDDEIDQSENYYQVHSRLAPPQEMLTTTINDHHQKSSTATSSYANIYSSFKFLTHDHQNRLSHQYKSLHENESQLFCVYQYKRPKSLKSTSRHLQHHQHQQPQDDCQLAQLLRPTRTRHCSSTKTSTKAITTKRQRYQNISRFAIFLFVLIFTIICNASSSLQQQQLSSTITAASSVTMPPINNRQHQTAAEADIAIMASSSNNNNNNNNNNSDINNHQHRHHHKQTAIEPSQQQQPFIEQVAKAEALTAPISASSAASAIPQAAALQQQSPAKLFEVCKSQLRTGQQLTNLSQIVFQPSDTCSTWLKMLRITNSDQSSASISSDSYPWHYIEQLDLSYNNLTVLHDSSGMSGLANLLELRITHNQLTRCEESSLTGLQRLQKIDLSHNKLQALPPKFFQPVRRTLKKLNLSFNLITVLVPNLFDSLGQLEYLDLSHNDITSHWINDRLFKNLTQLQNLDLSFNKLTVFNSQAAFSSLINLETLSLQHNELRQVPETIQHLRHLSSLDLSQNMIHDITNASYLSNCRLLFNLNLESNLLENITRDAFSDLPALKVLNLANNRIHYLDQQAFDYVPDLHALRLDSNKLTDFGQAFVNLRFLLMLNISSNRIGSFDYAHIPLGLQWLDLHSNKIDKLNNFYYSPSAQQQFGSNDIQQQQQQSQSIGQQWQSMLRLTTLDASYNQIKELDNTSLPESLETVQLNNNQIRTIASHTFSSKSNLTRINLSNNQLSTIAFDGLKLVNNQQQNHRDINLQHLLASTGAGGTNNGGQHQQKFVDIYMANNPFVCNCNMGWLSQLLLASSNLMQGSASMAATTAQAGALPRDHTFTNTYSMVLTRQLPRIADSHLINCHLPFGRQTPFHAVASVSNGQSPSSIGSTNRHQHDDQLHLWSPVLAANQLAVLHHNSVTAGAASATSSSSSSVYLNAAVSASSATTAAILSSSSTPLILKQSELLSSVHLCSYKSHCFALCYCCDFDACDCEMSCPENCSCYYDQTWSTNIVDCSANNQINGISSQTRFTQMMMGASGASSSSPAATGGHHHHHASNNHYRQQPSSFASASGAQQGHQQHTVALVKFTSIPEKIPMDVTELYLDGLELLHLRGNALIGRKNLKALFLNNSQLYSIEPKALATQKSLRILQLNSNFLTELRGYEFEHQNELRELYLANNRLSSIANQTFAPLKSLQILHLQNNLLYHFNFWSNLPAGGHRLISMNLGQNPWSCQCDQIEPMLQWLQLNVKHLHDRKSISCQFNTTTALHLLPPSSSSSSSALNLLGSASLQAAVNENYPMFDMRLCLNYTVYPVAMQPQSIEPASSSNEQQQGSMSGVYPPNNKNFQRVASSQDQPFDDPSQAVSNGAANPNFQPPLPNDEPWNSSAGRVFGGVSEYDPPQQYPPAQPQSPPQSTMNTIPASNNNFVSGRYGSMPAPMLTPSFVLGAATMLCVSLIALISLVHYRRSMRMWFYSNYGLNMFGSAAAKGKHHKHHHGSLGSSAKHNHAAAHLNHQYGPAASAGSSAASTSSSSATSSNLSQALFQHHHNQSSTIANNSNSGLVTTPLIVTNSNQVLNSATTTTTAASYNDDDKLYDAYLTYSKLDEQFVNDLIAPELEYGQPSYRVALHYRDLPVTTSEFLTDCIVETANASRRIIMVLSEQLLRTEWMQYEFRMAHLEALKGSNYKQRLVFILLGQLPNFATADAELVMWLKTCTCICWGDKLFWQRLRSAMPELPFSRQQQQQQQLYSAARYQTIAPHQTKGIAGMEQSSGGTKMSSSLAGVLVGSTLGGGKSSNRNLLGVNNLLKSAGGFFSSSNHSSNDNFANNNNFASQQRLVQQHTRRPLPMQPKLSQPSIAASQSSLYQAPPDSQQDEHHYAHLTPATMIQQQRQHTYHQPIFGDPNQQQQQQRDSVPVHI